MMEPADTTWMDAAECKGAPIDMFFLSRGEDARPAQSMCKSCPVRVECIQYALNTNCYEGIFGGLTHRGRLRWAKRQIPQEQAVA